ncbi:MAG: hypothetical protein WBQ14_08205 [Gaiellaceae bacterium]
MEEQSGIILVRPALVRAPVFWTPKFWAESAHALDRVRPETPLEQKPSAELEVSIDVTLQEVFETACEAWGLKLGSDRIGRGGGIAQEFYHFGFVDPDEDPDGISPGVVNGWSSTLPIARENGETEFVPALQVTYRELLASSSLGLLRGDVTRPYVDPVRPQGDFGLAVEVARQAVDAIRAAYAAVDDSIGYAEHTIRLVSVFLPKIDRGADRVIDEGIRLGALVAFARWLRKKLGHRRPWHQRR